jgi:hypothetical protein
MRRMTRSSAALPLLALLIPQIVLAHGATARLTRPVFVYPAERQTIPYNGSWSFAVRPMKGARGYLWSFVQDGVIRWQNLAFEGHLSGRAYTIRGTSRAHREIHPGRLTVWVQALLRRERWSRQDTLSFYLKTTPFPPTKTPLPQPTATNSLTYSGSWAFALPPVREARGYLWSFVQDGVIRWQNLAFEGRLSDHTYTISRISQAHRAIHPGLLTVWVRALLHQERWSRQVTLSFYLSMLPTPTAVPPTAVPPTAVPPTAVPPTAVPPTAVPPTPCGQLLYQADWSGGFDGWMASPDWKTVSGQLVDDGTNWDNTQFAHAPNIKSCTANYAVEADIQAVRAGNGCAFNNDVFGLSVRGETSGDYRVGLGAPGLTFAFIFDHSSSDGCPDYGNPLTRANYSLDTNWHKYRVEVRGNDIKLLIDGQPIIETIDNHHLTSNSVGLFSGGMVINVRSFKVTAL